MLLFVVIVSVRSVIVGVIDVDIVCCVVIGIVFVMYVEFVLVVDICGVIVLSLFLGVLLLLLMIPVL